MRLFRLHFFLLSFLFLIVISCSQEAQDIHSFANIDDVQTEHIDLNLKIDFEKKQISGTASLTINNLNKSNTLILDSRGLAIEKITLDDDTTTDFKFGEIRPQFGQPLIIDILPTTKKVNIYYHSSPQAEALQWLSAEQTAGKQYPFLFTQGQSILTRTWIPCQDTPMIRVTYSAQIKTEPGLMAVMSAENPTLKNDQGVYRFEMDQPIPSYLIALAVGDIEFRALGERSGVYAEPVMLDKAAYEFADTEKMMNAIEKLYGPYRWGRYDMIVLPPSFPFGGMENPRLTFLTPTIVTGDRSLVALVAHELAHSWSGNLVTNAKWDDIWLNEGFTTYLEYRIMEELYGANYAKMIEQLGYQDLLRELEEMGYDSLDSRLALDLSGRHPDESTIVAYDKGQLFLRALEEAYGREKFDAFLRKYFDSHAFQTMTSEKFLKYLEKELLKETKNTGQAVRAYEWVYNTGMPDNCPIPDSPEFRKVDEQRRAFVEGSPAAALQTAGWTTHHWMHFIRALPNSLSLDQLKELDTTFTLSESANAEIKFAWLKQAIHFEYKEAYPALENFLKSVGRSKFVVPLYRDLSQKDEAYAREIYREARPGYHPITTESIDTFLSLAQ